MAAYWHILLPYRISFQDEPEMQQAFDKKFGEGFIFEKIHEYEVEAPPLSDGYVMKFQRREKNYYLDPALLAKEFKPYYQYLTSEFKALYENKEDRGFYSSLFDEKVFPDFLRRFEELPFEDFTKSYIEVLEKMNGNYFIHFDGLAPMYVYEGYPLPSDSNSEMKVVSLLNSYEKMNVIGEETAAFFRFGDHLKEKGAEQFKIARYVFVAGY